jgi:aminoglycoside phosphotransferase (APT) family kinase protein
MSDLHGQIWDYLNAELPGCRDIFLTDPVPIVAGSSKKIWSFDAEWKDEYKILRTQPLILRQDADAGVVESDLVQEYKVLKTLEGWLLPIPVIFGADLPGVIFGRPTLLITREPGQAHRAVLRDKDPLGLGLEGQLRVARDMTDLLATLHTLEDPDLVAVLPNPEGGDPARHELARWEEQLDSEGLDPTDRLRPAREWLHANLPAPPARLTLVHGDFRPGNVLVDEGQLSCLLDWELARLGDPCDDLGWYTCSIYRVEHFLSGWTQKDFLEHYVKQGGTEPEPERLRFWQVCSVFRLAVIAMRSARNIEQGLAAGMPPPVDRVVERLLEDIT